MPTTLRRNTVIAFGLATLFDWSFMFAKHDQPCVASSPSAMTRMMRSAPSASFLLC